LVSPNYLKDYWECGDLQGMDHNTASVLIVVEDIASQNTAVPSILTQSGPGGF
jgi:hypothetical protein